VFVATNPPGLVAYFAAMLMISLWFYIKHVRYVYGVSGVVQRAGLPVPPRAAAAVLAVFLCTLPFAFEDSLLLMLNLL
jgi:hypothetical protein